MTAPVETRAPVGVARALPVVDAALRAVQSYQRADLAPALEATRRRLADPAVRVLVVGEFKQGKSSLVNALVDEDVCPVDDDVATSVPTIVRYGEEPHAWAVHDPPEPDGDAVREPVPFADLPLYASELGNPHNERGLQAVEVALPSEILRTGLVLVDTPGVGGLGSVHGAITMSALPMADALVFVSDASQELSGPEMEFLTRARDVCPNVFGVMPKTDFYPEWGRIRDIDLERLRAAGVRMGLIPISSTVHRIAVAEGDAELDAESGFPSVVEYLLDEIVARAGELAVRSAAQNVLFVVDQLERTFRSEREALASPEEAARVLRELEETKARVARVRTDAAGWVTTLNDGIGDLNSDADYEQRKAFRDILREAESSIDAGDPAKTWAEFEPWVYRRVAWAASQSYTVLQTSTRELAERVAEHFREMSGDADPLAGVHLPDLAGEGFDVDASADFKLEGAGEKTLTWLRGTYGGFAMFGMVGSLAGASMLNPITLPLSVLLGRKALKDERDRKLMMRRQEAKTAVRRYVDEAQFALGKDLRDGLRRIQREMRDGFQARAVELQRTTDEALAAAQQAAQGTAQQREQRLHDVDAELGRIGMLRQATMDLQPDLASAPAGAS
ncbi:MAG TPA: dynamin family protein [Acidimicrobiia bacterium]